MRLEWLEDIIAIADTGSFSGAAERRMLTQSAFSRRIQQIEDYVGVELFNRTHKPIRLKPTTAAQCEQIVLLTTALRQLVLDLRRGERMAENRVVIACQHSLTAMRVPALLQKLPAEQEEIYVRLRSANLAECAGMLLARKADLALVYRLPDDAAATGSDFFEEIVVGTDRLIPVFKTAMPELAAQDLSAHKVPYVTYPSDVFMGQVMGRKILPFLNPSLHPIPKVETALTLAAIEMAAIGMAVSWVPHSLAEERLKTAALFDLSAVLPACDLHIIAMRVHGAAGLAEAIVWSILHLI